MIRASKGIVRLLLPYRVWCILRLKIELRPVLPVQDFSALDSRMQVWKKMMHHTVIMLLVDPMWP